MKFKLSKYLTTLSLAVLAGCGGGGGEGTSRTGLTAVKVMGDSLSDSGAFTGIPSSQDGLGAGRIFSVQSSPGVTHQIWTERIAAIVGGSQLCNYFQQAGLSAPVATCGSFAVGGSRLNNLYKTGLEASNPFRVTKQIEMASALGDFKSSDLLLIDGGGNDAADLIGAYLKASTDGGTAFNSIVTSIPVAGIGAADLATAGTLYMQTLADNFYNSIKTHALDKGATHIAVLNIPAVTKTPRFQMVLGSVEQSVTATYGAAAGASAREGVEQLANAWIQAFNTRLASKFAGNEKVVVIDFYGAFLDQVAHPSQYGLTNVKDPACPPALLTNGLPDLGADGLPKYNFETCTAANLSANPPAGQSGPDWWKTYAFSDGFHPTPYGYQLMSQLVSRSLAQAGWIK